MQGAIDVRIFHRDLVPHAEDVFRIAHDAAVRTLSAETGQMNYPPASCEVSD